ncbi:hypothetical protein [Arthrobacter sp. UYEF36]|uniref:hypothetical protein n=1 Tax=Arthrobacter sp. UYEF36 TaxID=1756366 RepID=UPI00339834D0
MEYFEAAQGDVHQTPDVIVVGEPLIDAGFPLRMPNDCAPALGALLDYTPS